MKSADWGRFAEKVQLALASSAEGDFARGTSGVELEFNVLDERLRPVERVGFGPERRSFADYLVERHVPSWAKDRVQLEVFHWMVEAATRPYYSPLGTALEARVLEALVGNALGGASLAFGERFYALHGNLLYPVAPSGESIPDGWSLAKKRYLARCTELFGASLATAGIHTNHSYPEALLSWDFFHLPRHRREGRSLAEFRNDAVIRATRLLRPFCPLFIAVSASTPLACRGEEGASRVVLTGADSNRLLTFPNPPALDAPCLYASHADYLRISYDLVRRGVRFGANNWTPVRARSDVDPVNRNISATSEQLRELYRRGLYTAGEHAGLEEVERALVVENLCARVDLPMSRVEVRTDEGGDSLGLCLAKVAFKELLLLRVYAEEAYGASYAYDAKDVARARRNEAAAARDGLRAGIEHPFAGHPVPLRGFLARTLEELDPLSRALGYDAALEPLRAMAGGGPNPAEEARAWFRAELGTDASEPEVPPELLCSWIARREAALREELASIPGRLRELGDESAKLGELLGHLEAQALSDPALVYRVAPPAPPKVEAAGDLTAEVVSLASALVRIPSVTNCARERPDEVARCAAFLAGYLRDAGAEVRLFSGGDYPAVLAGFPGGLLAPVTLGGHFDVVEPDPNDTQFEPRVEGDYLWGRGAADMKTVVASYCVWMRRALLAGPPYPAANLLLVGNEENGEARPFGTPHVLKELSRDRGWSPQFMVLGERTGERGDERYGEVCTANRGVLRLRITARGERAHTGMAGPSRDLLDRLLHARASLGGLLAGRLTLEAADGWQTGLRFPFLNVGENGVYNVTAAEGVLGLEIRPIPEEDVPGLLGALEEAVAGAGLEMTPEVMEAGVACPPGNPHLLRLLGAVEAVSGAPARVGRKLAGTSARFAPGGNAVVWGQSGKAPHGRHEAHYIPSILPYINILDRFVEKRRGGPERV